MIVVDTHIWVWWANQTQEFTQTFRVIFEQYQQEGVGLSIISCWEVAKLVEKGRLKLNQPVEEWIDAAINLPNVELISLTPQIVIESTRLPPPFHNDPADQIIVATCRVLGHSLLTADVRLTNYPYVKTL